MMADAQCFVAVMVAICMSDAVFVRCNATGQFDALLRGCEGPRGLSNDGSRHHIMEAVWGDK